MGLYALPFAFVALWKRTEEMNPNVAHPKTGLHPLSTFLILGRLQVPYPPDRPRLALCGGV